MFVSFVKKEWMSYGLLRNAKANNSQMQFSKVGPRFDIHDLVYQSYDSGFEDTKEVMNELLK